MTYQCPVCGYNELINAPELFSICPCCGTEFGNTDFDANNEDLRARWLAKGAPWFDPGTPRTPSWSPEEQLVKAGFPEPATVK
jgi:hypothetical protein